MLYKNDRTMIVRNKLGVEQECPESLARALELSGDVEIVGFAEAKQEAKQEAKRGKKAEQSESTSDE